MLKLRNLLLVLAAAATAVHHAAAGVVDGPCSMMRHSSTGSCTQLNACLDSVQLNPAAAGNSGTNVTFAAANCPGWKLASSTSATATSASLNVTANAGVVQFSGRSDFDDIDVVRFAAPSCSGKMRVTSGTCLLSDKAKKPTSPQVVGPCQMKLQGALPSECSAMGGCLGAVSLAPKTGGGVTLTMNGSSCYTMVRGANVNSGMARLSIDTTAGMAEFTGSATQGKGFASFSLFPSGAAPGTDTGSADDDDTTSVRALRQLGMDSTAPCHATMRVTSGKCFFSDQPSGGGNNRNGTSAATGASAGRMALATVTLAVAAAALA